MMSIKLKIGEYLKTYGVNSILFKNFIIIFLVIMIPFGAVSIAVMSNTFNALKQERHNIINERLQKVISVNDGFFMSMSRLSASILEQNEVKRAMRYDDRRINLNPDYQQIMNQLNMFSLTYSYIQFICVYSYKNDHLVSESISGRLSDMSNIKWLAQLKDDTRDFFAKQLNIWGRNCTAIVRKTRVNNIDEGFLVILVDTDLFIQTWDVSEGDDQIFIYDNENGDLIFTSHLLEEPLPEDIDGYYVQADSDFFDWKYHYYADMTYFDHANKNAVNMTIFICILTPLLCLILTLLLSLKTFRPIATIMQQFTSIEKRNLAYNDMNEISYITRNILTMLNENESLTDEIEKKLLVLNNAQIYALQYQINPHFIYNTLEMLKWMIVEIEPKDNHAASGTITKLSRIFKYSLDMRNYLVNIREEIANTKTYIEMLHSRYGDIFSETWNIDDNAYQHKVVKLTLQPLIENAVYHGIRPSGRKGNIKIDISEVNGKLKMIVYDDGIGMSEEQLLILKEQIENEDVFSGGHIGLCNLNQRIQLIFGKDYGIGVEAEGGFKVTICIP